MVLLLKTKVAHEPGLDYHTFYLRYRVLCIRCPRPALHPHWCSHSSPGELTRHILRFRVVDASLERNVINGCVTRGTWPIPMKPQPTWHLLWNMASEEYRRWVGNSYQEFVKNSSTVVVLLRTEHDSSCQEKYGILAIFLQLASLNSFVAYHRSSR